MVMYVDNRKTACLVYWRASDMTGHCNLLHEKRLVWCFGNFFCHFCIFIGL